MIDTREEVKLALKKQNKILTQEQAFRHLLKINEQNKIKQ